MKDITASLIVYQVGGCVRDEILGISSSDRDYVVVGSSVEQMLSLGFIPVGKHFPVFLHPQTHEEYALARTEQKSGIGYHGFTFYTAPQVTLNEDLARRDLTINAIAKDHNNQLIDPYNGINDLKQGILRHVSDAFIEDPLRVLRVARFSAKFAFQIAPSTCELIKQIVASNELKSLPLERIYLEFEKALDCKYVFNFFKVLFDSGALNQVLTEFSSAFVDADTLTNFKSIINLCANPNFKSNHKYALLYYFLSTIASKENILNTLETIPTTNENKTLETLCIKHYSKENILNTLETIPTTNKNKTLATLSIKHYSKLISNLDKFTSSDLLHLIKQLDYNRKPSQFADLQSVVLSLISNNSVKTIATQNFEFIIIASNALKQFNYDTLENKSSQNINQIKIKLIDDTKKSFYRN